MRSLTLAIIFPAVVTLAQQKYASVNTSKFATEIIEYKQKIEEINKDFEQQVTTVQRLAADVRDAELDLETNRLNYTESVRRQKAERLDELRKRYKRLSEDLEEAIQKRTRKDIDPLKDKIIQELSEFAKANGIDWLIDSSVAAERMGLVQLLPQIDVTEDFIKHYNSKYPSSASSYKKD